MPSKLMTPGVYIEEKNAFPNSAVAVETAVPAFIGYTEIAERNGKSLVSVPTRITSFAEYAERFGGAYKPKYKIDAPDPDKPENTFMLNGKERKVVIADKHTPYMFNSIRLFYANGGGPCYIISIGTYKNMTSFEVSPDDYIGSDAKKNPPLKLLEKEFEPTLIVTPDAINLGTDCYSVLYSQVLAHCAAQQNRFGIFDLVRQKRYEETKDVVVPFREGVGINFLNYGAAYYPWLRTAIVQPGEVDFENLDASVDLAATLPEEKAIAAVNDFKKKSIYSTTVDLLKALVANNKKNLDAVTAAEAAEKDEKKKKALTDSKTKFDGVDKAANAAVKTLEGLLAKLADPAAKDEDKKAWADGILAAEKALEPVSPKFAESAKKNFESVKLNYHQSLKASSSTYVNILEEVRAEMNELPPSGAMAGIYTSVDNSRGVWKSPANVSVNMVNAPSVNINHEGQESLNVDVMSGKSINVIRAFPGIGCLVWGGRTLDGNSQDWRYINVRRTLIMIEQSLKLATRAYVFEPNDSNTWITVKSMFSNFLTNLWKQGALAGSAPEQAFDVQVGLGATMTPNDILDGKMLITVKVAIVRPAEFIVITFQQQMQQS